METIQVLLYVSHVMLGNIQRPQAQPIGLLVFPVLQANTTHWQVHLPVCCALLVDIQMLRYRQRHALLVLLVHFPIRVVLLIIQPVNVVPLDHILLPWQHQVVLFVRLVVMVVLVVHHHCLIVWHAKQVDSPLWQGCPIVLNVPLVVLIPASTLLRARNVLLVVTWIN
jgi:hypothetical protein